MEQKKPMLSREFFSKKEVEAIYGLKLSKINNLMKKKKLIYYKIEREVRFKKTDVDAYFESNKKI